MYQPFYLVNRPLLSISVIPNDPLTKVPVLVVPLVDHDAITDWRAALCNRCDVLSNLLSTIANEALDHGELPGATL